MYMFCAHRFKQFHKMQVDSRTANVGRTFYPFKRLPIELRYTIWIFSLAPRVVECRNKSSLDERHFDFHAKAPVAFHVCHESRNATMPLYSLLQQTIHFNWSLDTLYFDDSIDYLIFQALDHSLDRLQNIAVSDKLRLGRNDDYHKKLVKSLGGLPALKSVQTVCSVEEPIFGYVAGSYRPSPGRLIRHSNVLAELGLEQYYFEKEVGGIIELSEDFPHELAEKCRVVADRCPKPSMRMVTAFRDLEGGEVTSILKRTTPVFVWRR